MSRLVIIDGNSLIHRAFHALPTLNTPNGEPVNAVYGFTSMLIKVLSELKPTHMAVAFDTPSPTFRHSLYPLYKSHRPPVKEEMEPQFEKVRKVVAAFGIPIFIAPGYEGDDIIGTLARQGEEEKKVDDILIVTGDLDTLQLIDKKTKIFTTRKGITDTITYDEQAVIARYGIKPYQMVDFKALRGDPSDEIPGVAGIGEKTAVELVNQFGSVEDIYNHINEIKDKTKALLIANYETAILSKKLAHIDRHIPVELNLADAVVKTWEEAKIVALFQEYGFRSLVRRLFGEETSQDSLFSNLSVAPASKEGKVDYSLLDSKEKLTEILNSDFKEITFDTETTSLNAREAELVGFSFSIKPNQAYYASYNKDWLPLIKKVLESPDILKIGHNIKYDMTVMSNYGIEIKPPFFDTLIAAYLLNPGSRSLNLKSLAYSELGIMMTEISELLGTGRKQLNMSEVSIEKVKDYAAADADVALKLKRKFEPKLKEHNLESVFSNIELPLIKILEGMEKVGIKLDVAFLSSLSHELGKYLADIENSIYKNVGHEFNINSTKQLAVVLFDELKLPATQKTKTGYSTDESVLQSLKGSHPVIDFLLSYRELFKLKSTYVDSLPNLISAKDGRLHTNFNQTIAATGRLSSNEPNLQNIPAGEGYGRKVRQAFIAEKGKTLFSADYSQIELRIMAHYTQDPKMLEAFEKGDDIHATVAAEVFNIPVEKVSAEQRRSAKTINFGLMYGLGAHGLAQQLGISRSDASTFINRYFTNFSKVKFFLEKLKEEVRAKGYVETITGRKRFMVDINSSVPQIRAAAERAAVNHPFQGTAADIIKIAMINIDKKFKELKINQPMILQVHDELIFEVDEGKFEELAKIVKPEMENAIKLSVPIQVDIKRGPNWAEMVKVNV